MFMFSAQHVALLQSGSSGSMSKPKKKKKKASWWDTRPPLWLLRALGWRPFSERCCLICSLDITWAVSDLNATYQLQAGCGFMLE